MQWAKTVLLMAIMTFLFLVVGYAAAGREGAVAALILAAGFNFFAYWMSDKLVLKRYHAREVGPDDTTGLYDLVRELADRDRLPMPRVYVIPTETPNAFATGRNPKHAAVAATAGILRLLDRRELKGVIAHELSHVKHRDILTQTVAATLAGAIGYLAFGARFRAFFGDRRNGGNNLILLLVAILGPLAAMMIQLAVSRAREFAADAGAARLTHDPEALADALLRLEAGVARRPLGNEAAATAHLFIVNPLRGGGMARLFSTHPPVEERVARLRAMAGRRI